MGTTTSSKPRKQKKQSREGSNQDAKGQQGQNFRQRVEATLARLEKQDPGLKQLLKKAHGYCVFPSVGKAALVVGGSYGRGAVFEKGKMIGYATIAQMTIGVQIGGDTFTEILVFHDPGQLDRFKSGHMAFAANASAVLVKAAAAGTTDFKGVTALAYSSGGMLLELSLGGQKFRFKPLGEGKDEESGGGKGKSGAQSSRGQSDDADDEDASSDDEESEDGEGMLQRAVSGLSQATEVAKKATEAAKAHPIAASVIGAGVATGLAFMLVRALRQGSQGSSDSESGYDDDEQEDDESDENGTDAQGSDDADYEDDEDDESDDESESEEEEASPRRHRRSRA